MSLNRDKEYPKEEALKVKDFIAKAKNFDVLTPEAMIEKIVEKEVFVDNPELTDDLKKAVLNLQEANDLLEFKDDAIKVFADQIETANAQIAEDALTIDQLSKEAIVADNTISDYNSKLDDAETQIKGLESKNLKLTKALKQFTE